MENEHQQAQMRSAQADYEAEPEKRPTITELEAIIDDPDSPDIEILPDGSVQEKGPFESLDLKCEKVSAVVDPKPTAPPPRYAAAVNVSLEFLEQWLDLPKGVRVKAVVPPGLQYRPDICQVYLVDETGDWLPEQELGCEPHSGMTVYETDEDSGMPRLKEFQVNGLVIPVPCATRRQHETGTLESAFPPKETTEEAEAEADCWILCKGCGWKGSPDETEPSVSPYHDMSCPKCGTTNLDTSEINKAWAANGDRYGYGDRNSLQQPVADDGVPSEDEPDA